MTRDLLPMIAVERRRAADLIESLTPAQMGTPSLCAGWSVHEVAAHMAAPFAVPSRDLLPLMLRSGFRLHVANTLLARRIAAERSAADLAALLRENAEHPFRGPIVGHFGQLTDLQVHAQDIRRPLGLGPDLDPEPMRVSLDFLMSRRAVGFVTRGRLAALRFEATDLDWAAGAGATVRGAAEALMLAVSGRPAALGELAGDGVPVLRRRLRA